VTVNGWDSDPAAGPPPGDSGPENGNPAGTDDPLAGSAAPASEHSVGPGGYTRGWLPGSSDQMVPGMAVRGQALDYVLSQQRRRMRTVGAVAAAVLAIGVVAGVIAVAVHNGSSGKTGPAQLTAEQVVQQAARQQMALNSETATISEQVSGTTSATIAGTVEVQRKPLLMSMNMKLSIGSTATLGGILTGNSMYIKLTGVPGMPAALGAKWLEIPLTGLKQSSVFGGLQRELQNENPNSQFAGLSSASHLRAVGTQVVSGVSTTKYTGWFAPAAAIKSLPAAERSVLAPNLHLIQGNVTFSVWIDSNHYVRKIQETESVGGEQVQIECTYGSFNQPVKITLPPASQIYAPPASVLNE
jgi:hypothetical protein